jgi:hypothetical protein
VLVSNKISKRQLNVFMGLLQSKIEIKGYLCKGANITFISIKVTENKRVMF